MKTDAEKYDRWGRTSMRAIEDPMWSKATRTDYNVLTFFATRCVTFETGVWRKAKDQGTVAALAAKISEFKGHDEHRAANWARQVRRSWARLAKWGLVATTPRGLVLLRVGLRKSPAQRRALGTDRTLKLGTDRTLPLGTDRTLNKKGGSDDVQGKVGGDQYLKKSSSESLSDYLTYSDNPFPSTEGTEFRTKVQRNSGRAQEPIDLTEQQPDPPATPAPDALPPNASEEQMARIHDKVRRILSARQARNPETVTEEKSDGKRRFRL